MGGPPPTEAKVIFMRAVGGEIGAASSLAPKVGPLGMSPKTVGEQIKAATMDWLGMKVTVKLVVVNRQATVSVVPSAASLIIRALNDPGDKSHKGNITFKNILDTAKTMRRRSIARKMVGTVKEILGTAYSVGCTIDGQHPRDIIAQINDGSLIIDDYEAPAEEAQ
jgi:large subunit ribosomal protein L12e